MEEYGEAWLEVNNQDETITIFGQRYSFGFFKAMKKNKDVWIHVDKHGIFRPYGNLKMPIPTEE